MYKFTKFAAAGLIIFALAFFAHSFSSKQNSTNQNAAVQQTADVSNLQQPTATTVQVNQQSSNAAQASQQPKIIQASTIANQDPVTLRVPSINLTAPIVRTGLEADGSLHVPSNPTMTGWYDLGPKPGDVGPSVITGHYDSAAGPGVLYNLKKVKVGDEVDVIRNDGSVAVFKVDKLETYPQDNFATKAVYGSISYPGLRIITCSGVYSRATQHYSDDLVVYATLVNIQQQGSYQAK